MAVMLREGLTSVPAEMRSLSARFTPPEIVSPSGRADAFSKLTAGIDGFGSTRVGQEYAGLDRGQIDRLQSELKAQQAGSRLSALLAEGQRLRAEANSGDSTTGVGVSVSEPVLGSDGATGS